MMPRVRRVTGVVFGVAALTAALLAQAPTFRATAQVVLVPVWVKDGNKQVSGLSAGDFELLDNGVAQEVSSTAAESNPVDVTLLLDTSGSLQGAGLETLKAGIQRISRSLRPTDRVRLLTFAADVTDISGARDGGTPLPVERVEGGGETAFYNALAVALMATPRSDRPQLVFAVSDALDTLSFVDANQVVTLAGSSSAALYVAVVRQVRQFAVRSVWATRYDDPNIGPLRDAAVRTGGLLFENPAGTTLPALFSQALEDFRTSYLLSYTPQGISTDGAHEIIVRTKDRRYSVRARKGYRN